jgi:hypothetical protein
MALLEEFVGFDWFSRAGSFVVTEHEKPVSDWSQAFGHCQSDDWKNLKLEFANQLRERLQVVSMDVYNAWSAVERPLKVRLAEVVEPRVREYLRTHQLPGAILSSVQRDVLHAAMEERPSSREERRRCKDALLNSRIGR